MLELQLVQRLDEASKVMTALIIFLTFFLVCAMLFGMYINSIYILLTLMFVIVSLYIQNKIWLEMRSRILRR